MRVVTVRPPWSELLAMKIKKAEFRSWRTGYRGRLAIHAGVTVDDAAREYFWRIACDPALAAREFPRPVSPEDLERLRGRLAHPRRGVVLAVGRLASCEKSEHWQQEPGFSEESWAWILEDMVELRREVRIVGRQGLFTASPQDADRIRAAVLGESEVKVRLESPPRTGRAPGARAPRYEQRGRFKVPVED